MATETTIVAWPAPAELASAVFALGQAQQAVDGIATLGIRRLGEEHELLDDVEQRPSFEYLGQLAHVIASIEYDLDYMRDDLGKLREAHDAAAVRMEITDA